MFPEKLPNNPLNLFKDWFELAKADENIKEPTAMSLATTNKESIPSIRTVLLKSYDEKGFCFYTNLKSKKAQELLSNPYASLCFYWIELDLQIRIDGTSSLIANEQADKYYSTRPRESQIGAWASKQSQIMESEEQFFADYNFYHDKFKDLEHIPRPKFWSGFCIKPYTFEFWQQGKQRLHKRYIYKLENNIWNIFQLYP